MAVRYIHQASKLENAVHNIAVRKVLSKVLKKRRVFITFWCVWGRLPTSESQSMMLSHGIIRANEQNSKNSHSCWRTTDACCWEGYLGSGTSNHSNSKQGSVCSCTGNGWKKSQNPTTVKTDTGDCQSDECMKLSHRKIYNFARSPEEIFSRRILWTTSILDGQTTWRKSASMISLLW